MADDNPFNGLMPIGTVFARVTQTLEVPGQGIVWVLDEITPEIASGILARQHPHQRKPRASHVQKIANAMRAGRYMWTGDPIKLDRQGRVIDGQHRLHAIVSSGVTVKQVMVAQIEDEQVLRYIDAVTAPRSLGDVRRVGGSEPVNGAVMAAILLEHSGFQYHKRQQLSKPEAAEIIDRFPYMDEACELHKIGRSQLGVTSGTIAGALRCVKANPEAAMKVFRAAFANQHTIDGVHQPIVKLLSDSLMRQKRLRADKSKDPNDDAVTGAAKAIRAYNAWRLGESLAKLARPSSGVIPEPVR